MALNRAPTPAAELLVAAGKLLYGDVQWMAQLAHELGINVRTLQAWASGKTQLKSDHPVLPRVEALLATQARQMALLVARLRASYARPPARSPAR